MTIELRRPELSELSFRQKMLSDPKTMAYNEKWGGTIEFPRERWVSWYARWVSGKDGKRFYRFLFAPEENGFVGETAYHLDEESGLWMADVIVCAQFRGRGYGRAGLRLLVHAARENGLHALCDEIAADSAGALQLFRSEGFCEKCRTEDAVLLEKRL